MAEPRQESLDKMWKFIKGFAEKSGTTMHPMPAVTEAVARTEAFRWIDELPSDGDAGLRAFLEEGGWERRFGLARVG